MTVIPGEADGGPPKGTRAPAKIASGSGAAVGAGG